MDQVNSFQGRRIVLGVCGGIAAYKAIELCRQLVDAGAFVSVVMTESSKEFVGEATFSALSSEAVWSSLFAEQDPIPHTRLGQAADLIVVAPATARLISAYATGYSHDLLTNVLLATRAPVVICPAMHTEMWEHPAVQDNLKILSQRGVHVVDPEEGRLAGGDIGSGRLAGTERVLEAMRGLLSSSSPSGEVRGDEILEPSASGLHGLSVLVTAGGTREPIDPVRYIGNRSSGKQGHALAEEALARGADARDYHADCHEPSDHLRFGGYRTRDARCGYESFGNCRCHCHGCRCCGLCSKPDCAREAQEERWCANVGNAPHY